MRFRVYDNAYGTSNVVAELDQMIDSGLSDAEIAAAKFYVAMAKMEEDGRSYGLAVSLDLVNGYTFAPHAALRVRRERGHHLYFTFIKRPIAPTGEVRVVLAAPDPEPKRGSAQTAAERHNVMTRAA
jgi:hypothetical protein